MGYGGVFCSSNAVVYFVSHYNNISSIINPWKHEVLASGHTSISNNASRPTGLGKLIKMGINMERENANLGCIILQTLSIAVVVTACRHFYLVDNTLLIPPHLPYRYRYRSYLHEYIP